MALAEEVRMSGVGALLLTRAETLRGIRLYDWGENREFRGKSLREIAQRKGMDPIEAVLEVLADEWPDMYGTGVIVCWMGRRTTSPFSRSLSTW